MKRPVENKRAVALFPRTESVATDALFGDYAPSSRRLGRESFEVDQVNFQGQFQLHESLDRRRGLASPCQEEVLKTLGSTAWPLFGRLPSLTPSTSNFEQLNFNSPSTSWPYTPDEEVAMIMRLGSFTTDPLFPDQCSVSGVSCDSPTRRSLRICRSESLESSIAPFSPEGAQLRDSLSLEDATVQAVQNGSFDNALHFHGTLSLCTESLKLLPDSPDTLGIKSSLSTTEPTSTHTGTHTGTPTSHASAVHIDQMPKAAASHEHPPKWQSQASSSKASLAQRRGLAVRRISVERTQSSPPPPIHFYAPSVCV